MTATQIARTLHGRRIAPGKWMAKCVAHPDKTASLSITDMGNGRTRLHCFSGCPQKAVLEAMGLDWRDLTDAKPMDREAYKAIEMERECQAQASVQRRAIYGRLCDMARFWEYQAGEAGKLLAMNPASDMLNALFHESLRNVRILNAAIAPMLHPAHGLTETIIAKRRRQ
jgi:hypothetical protein